MLSPFHPAPGGHTYRFELKSGWLLRLSFEQQGMDVVVRVLAPDGREILLVDSPTGGEGSEEVWLVADSPGLYRVLVRAWGGSGGEGRYEPRLLALRPATAGDRSNSAAERLFYRGMYLEAARAWQILKRPEREADAWERLGSLRSGEGDWQGALEAHRRARDLYRAAGARRPEVLSLEKTAEAHQALGELEESRRARLEALPLWDALGETWNVVATSYRLCQLLYLRGLAREALECYERVLESWKELRCASAQGMVRIDIGTLYTSLGEFDRALESYREALALLAGPESQSARGAAHTQIGNAYLKSGFPRRALARFEKALALSRATGNLPGEASALNGMGLAWQRIGEPERAFIPFRRALDLFERGGSRSAQATIWNNIGRLHLAQGQPGSASQAFRRALDLSSGVGDRQAQSESLSGMARAARMQGDWTAARQHIERALDLVETLRTDMAQGPPLRGQLFLMDLLKATYMASKQDDYAFLIDLLMERGYDALALEVSERSQARSLSDSLEPDPGAPAALSLQEIRRSVLDDDTALLAYSLGEERSFLWWVTRTGLASFELPGRPVLEKAARKIHGLTARSHRRESEVPARRKAMEVSRLLLGPVADRLGGGRLLIVAPDFLQYVPFETLPHPGEGSPLLVHHQVVRIPSATVLDRLRARSAGRERARTQVFMLGGAAFTEEGSGMKRLSHADDEIRSVRRLARGAEVLAATGFDAVRELFLGGALRRSSILHFATHGLTDVRQPGRSALLLSTLDRRGRALEGWLRAEEIRELDLEIDLAVLSACETALGREVGGEGLVGLSQSFLSAGAAGVVGSLWKVDDRATAELMERFYLEMLVRRRPPAEAFREAQLSLRNQRRWSAPYYWGGFVLQGDWLNKSRSEGSP